MGGEADEMDYKDEEDGRDVREEGEGNRDWSVAGELRGGCVTPLQSGRMIFALWFGARCGYGYVCGVRLNVGERSSRSRNEGIVVTCQT
jgi:hypothetical protein